MNNISHQSSDFEFPCRIYNRTHIYEDSNAEFEQYSLSTIRILGLCLKLCLCHLKNHIVQGNDKKKKKGNIKNCQVYKSNITQSEPKELK